ncbi:hypothetical protein AAFF_G00125230 [Aldrovandia affinis]|uniref:Uncharacterized protein n=1 Tax=Aldrovandia affinis TaxID=143900 RepID=A0AAD7W9K9_9TELE|nr:hypothetical protein AAFF_G00125230 [Aldrovandia affinis]
MPSRRGYIAAQRRAHIKAGGLPVTRRCERMPWRGGGGVGKRHAPTLQDVPGASDEPHTPAFRPSRFPSSCRRRLQHNVTVRPRALRLGRETDTRHGARPPGSSLGHCKSRAAPGHVGEERRRRGGLRGRSWRAAVRAAGCRRQGDRHLWSGGAHYVTVSLDLNARPEDDNLTPGGFGRKSRRWTLFWPQPALPLSASVAVQTQTPPRPLSEGYRHWLLLPSRHMTREPTSEGKNNNTKNERTGDNPSLQQNNEVNNPPHPPKNVNAKKAGGTKRQRMTERTLWQAEAERAPDREPPACLTAGELSRIKPAAA